MIISDASYCSEAGVPHVTGARHIAEVATAPGWTVLGSDTYHFTVHPIGVCPQVVYAE